MKKSVVFLFSFILLLGILMVSAEEVDLSTIDENAELEVTGGIAPDSAFYFIDEFFDNFADAVKVRQEKVAEIRDMIEAGQYEDALEALERYKRHAEEFEREVSPEQRDEARRSAAAIYNVLKSLEAQIPDEYKADLFDDIIKREKGIVTAAEIANRIKKLCEELSELDPLQYSRICKTDDDSPEWQQRLHRDLTEEQRQEAEAFFEIMLECFETSGGTCRCEDISITTFADKCSVIAPLAYACDVENNEAACDKMDEIEEEEPIEDLLPDYLQDVLRAIEDRFEDEQFDHHASRECRDAGATTRQECMKIMFRLHAPPACVEALERGEISLDNEREAREVCEGIMFDLEAPQECIEEGLTDFRECGKLMFQLYAPQECIDAGLTGDHRGDERKCQEIVGDFGRGPGPGPGSAVYCSQISNSDERLACYDAALSGERFEHEGDFREDYEGKFDDRNYEIQRQCAEMCYKEGKTWTFSSEGICECFGGEYKDFSGETPYDCSLLDCFGGSYCDPYKGCVSSDFEQPIEQPTLPYIVPPECGEGEYIECIENICKCVTEETATQKLPSTEETTFTGAVISDNEFFRYYFR